MDGVKVLTEAEIVSAASASAQVQSQSKSKTREANCIKTADDVTKTRKSLGPNCQCTEPAENTTLAQCAAEADELANALEVKVNLESEHCVNGLTNGNVEETKTGERHSALSDAKLLSESSSPSAVPVQNGSLMAEHGLVSDSAPESISGVKKHNEIVYVSYESELQMPLIMRIMNKDLSEPYSIYTYRYFIYNWPKLCFLAMIESECVGAIVCKLDLNRKSAKRGYIAMLAVDSRHRNKGIGSNLVLKAIGAMVALNADEVVLESEITNTPALRLYENLGFVRDKRLFRYYLNGVDAFRLKLWLK